MHSTTGDHMNDLISYVTSFFWHAIDTTGPDVLTGASEAVGTELVQQARSLLSKTGETDWPSEEAISNSLSNCLSAGLISQAELEDFANALRPYYATEHSANQPISNPNGQSVNTPLNIGKVEQSTLNIGTTNNVSNNTFKSSVTFTTNVR